MTEAAKRAYARIELGKKLGLRLVNQSNQSFFIYAEQLLGLAKTEDNITLIKKRDREPEKAIGYHPGSVFAVWQSVADGEAGESSSMVRVSLFFGEAEKKVEYVRKTRELRNVIDTQEYLLPREEWQTLVRAIEIMTEQREQFDRLKIAAECDPGFEMIEIDEVEEGKE